MSTKKRAPLYKWEKEMIDAFQEHQWQLVLNPLYEQFQRWKAGEVSHLEMDKAIYETHKSCQEVYRLFTNKHDFLARAIQANEGWFSQWVKDHPKPGE